MENDNKLDDEWIHTFENSDKLYKDFYKDDLYYVTIKSIYINNEHNINKITCDTLLLKKPNHISREEITEILKNNAVDDNIQYSLFSILKFNISLEPDDIKNYLTNATNPEYLSVVTNIDTIYFDKSITMFHDLNDIYIIFYEPSPQIKH